MIRLCDLTDRDLIERALAHDKVAFGELVTRYDGKLLHFLRHRSSVCDADDVRQNTWLLVVEKLHTYQFRSTFYTWLCAIAKREKVSMHRCHYYGHPKVVADSYRVQRGVYDNPLDHLMRQEEVQHVRRVLESGILKPFQRETVLRFYYHTQTVAAIAVEMETPVGTVQQRLDTSRKKLKAALA